MNQFNLNKIVEYYNNYDEENRLIKENGYTRPEYIITMDYIHKYLKPGAKILEIGAGPGTYSLALAKEGYDITAVELVPKNLSILRSKITDDMKIDTYLGNAIDLSFLEDNTYDMVLSLGPMYHIFSEENLLRAMREAERVCKSGGFLYFAYCGVVASIFSFCFQKHKIREASQNRDLNSNWDFIPNESSKFNLLEKYEIDALVNNFDKLQRLHFVGVDAGYQILHNYDEMEEYEAERYIDFIKHIAEREDCLGLSNHYLDILIKHQ